MVNLTPHAVHLHLTTGEVVTFPPSGVVARAKEIVTPVGERAGVRIVTIAYGEIENVPPHSGETYEETYIVSALVRAALPERFDLFSPGALVRNEAGVVVGCRTLVMNAGAR